MLVGKIDLELEKQSNRTKELSRESCRIFCKLL